MYKLLLLLQLLSVFIPASSYTQDIQEDSLTNTYSTDILPFIQSANNSLSTTNISTNVSTETNNTALDIFAAITKNDRQLVSEILTQGVDPNTRDSYYRTPLMYANNESLEIVELLLARGAYINTRDSSGNTVLMMASEKGYTELVKLLLNYSILINAENRQGITAFHLAVQNGHTAIVNLLMDHSANIQYSFPNGLPPVFEATKNGYTAIVQSLLKRGINPNSKVPSTGTSLLGIASAFGYESTVKVLLDAGADPNLPNNLGITPIFLSIGKKNINITELLLQSGASTKIKTKDGLSLFDITHPTDTQTIRLLNRYKTNR